MSNASVSSVRLSLRNISITALALTLVALVAVRLLAGSQETTIIARPLPVAATVVKLDSSYQTWRSYSGRAVATRSSRLAFEQSGTLVDLMVDEGLQVIKGQVLARLDTARLTAQKAELAAEQDEVAANLALAEKTLKRSRKTFAQGHLSAQRLDEQEANLMSLAARRKRLQASQKSLDVALDKSVIKAPFDGEITARLIDEGTVVTAGTPVFSIREAGALEAHVGMSPADAKAIQAGGRFQLLDSQARPIKATFKTLVASIVGQTRTMKTVFIVDDPRILDGEILSVRTRKEEMKTGAWLPVRSISADVRGLWRVYKIISEGENQRVVYENIQILHTEEDRVYVTGSLSDGDLVIAGGTDRLAPGQHVAVLDGEDRQGAKSQAARP